MMLYIQDFMDVYNDNQSIAGGLGAAAGGFVGSRINTYEKSTKGKRRLTINKYKLRFSRGDFAGANNAINKYNMENPENIIDKSKIKLLK